MQRPPSALRLLVCEVAVLAAQMAVLALVGEVVLAVEEQFAPEASLLV